MAYVVYEYDSEETLFDIANAYSITVSELAKINNIIEPFDPRPSNISYLNGTILVPDIQSGNESYENRDRDYVATFRRTTQRPQQVMSVGLSTDVGWNSVGKCFIIIDGTTYKFPCYPESFSDTRQSNVTSQNPLGRSEPFQIYQNSGPRVVNVSFKMHREMCSDTEYVAQLVAAVQSATYPTGLDTIIPKVILVIGKSCYIEGIIEGSVSVDWSETINKKNQYNVVTLGFSVTECTGVPKTSGEIRSSYRL
jgi:hypothetical protein